MFDKEEKLVMAARRWRAVVHAGGASRSALDHALDELYRATVEYEQWRKLRPLKVTPSGGVT